MRHREAYQSGPFRIERDGCYVTLSSHWKPDEFKRNLERIRQDRPAFKSRIDEKALRLLSLAESANPLEFVSCVAVRHCFGDPEKYRESERGPGEAVAEYALNIALSVASPKTEVHATSAQLEEFEMLVQEVLEDVLLYFGTEMVASDKSEFEQTLRFRSVTSYIFVRGDSYEQHSVDLVRRLFQPHDAFLRENYSLTTDQLLSLCDELVRQVLANLNALGELARGTRALMGQFGEWSSALGSPPHAEALRAFKSLPPTQPEVARLTGLAGVLERSLFELRLSDTAPEHVLAPLSAEFGDNSALAGFEKSPCWPTNNSITTERPLVRHAGKYYCFIPQLLWRNLSRILEAMIRKADPTYFADSYQKSRGAVLNQTALEFLRSALPGSKACANVFYPATVGNKTTRREVDGLVLFDRHLFIVETKAGALPRPARRGGLEGLTRAAKDLIGEAHEQTSAAREYITKAEVARFEHPDGTTALELRGAADLDSVCLVNVTLDRLGFLATHQDTLSKMGVVPEQDWLWSVFVNDLRVITEMVEHPAEFVHYVEQRLRVNSLRQIRTCDELDIFMYYLRNWLDFNAEFLARYQQFGFWTYTEELDRYYDFRAGRVSSGPKPRLNISNKLRELLHEVESTGDSGRTSVACAIMDLGHSGQSKLVELVETIKHRARQDGKEHDASVGSALAGVTCTASGALQPPVMKKYEAYCRVKMYETKIERWAVIGFHVPDDRTEKLDVRALRQEWRRDPELETKAKLLRQSIARKTARQNVAPGRNDSCPCGSGRKYKMCCGRPGLLDA